MKWRTMTWYDVTIALTYPAVLGAIIYSFLNSVVQVGVVADLMPLLGGGHLSPAYDSQTPFLAAFHLRRAFTISAFTLLTFAVISHFSADFLYSKYSQGSYSRVNFAFDTLIAILIALSYITVSTLARLTVRQAQMAFFIFWAALFVIYAIFFFWDLLDYRCYRSSDAARKSFYAGMMWPFEASALAAWVLLAIGAFYMSTRTWYDYAYVSAGALTLSLYSVWLWRKMLILESNEAAGSYHPESATKKSEQLLTIRGAETDDLERCARIFVDAYQETYGESWSLEAAELRLGEILSVGRKYCCVLAVNGTVQGFLFARPFSWHDGGRLWIEEVVLVKEFRGMGYGTLLLQTLNRIADENKILGYSLIAQRDSRAYSFYFRHGYIGSDWIHLERNRKLLP